MINKEQVATLCEEALANTDRFLVEVKVKPNNVIEVYVDSDTAVNIDHCAELSRYINEKLDRDVEDYELTVLSWGLSGALKMDRQLQKYVGKDVEVKTKDGWEENAAICAAIEAEEKLLGDNGRILVRPSGTEPLIRVMAEGPEQGQLEEICQRIADIVRAELGA